MSVLRFASEEGLRFALTSGLVPAAVGAGPARARRTEEGAVLVAPEVAVTAAARARLVAAGVTIVPAAALGTRAERVGSWAEIVRAVPSAEPIDATGIVLFHVPEGELVALAGELLRLGCDRLGWRAAPDGFLLRAAAPPLYSVLRAVDGAGGARAFLPTPRGQERVFTAAGWEHPLVRLLAPEPGAIVLVGPAGLSALVDAPFEDAYALVDLAVPGPPARVLTPVAPPRIRVPLRLARAPAGGRPALWVLRDAAVARVERLLGTLPEDVVRGLLFAVGEASEGPVVILRLRPGARMETGLEAEEYRVHPAIGNLFLPGETLLEPPLRRDHVRERLAPDPDAIVWLRSLGEGRFAPESMPDAAFRPLAEWVDWVVDASAPALAPWVASATFAFDAFVGTAAAAAPVATEEAAAPPVPRRRSRREPPPAAEPAPAPEPDVAAARARPLVAAGPLVPAVVDPSVAAAALAGLERAYLDLDVPADAPERSALWARMAPLSAELGRPHDAALAWARVVWQGEGDAVLGPWLAAEAAATGGAGAAALLAAAAPTRDEVRRLAVLLLAGEPTTLARVHDVALWLERHDDALDVRTAWLARLAVSRSSGGDRLGLARARDRLLARIHRGLSVERDVPAFLRRAGAGRDAAQIEVIAGRLEALLTAFETTKRRRSATEADPRLTGAYVRFVVAYGFARLGLGERASALCDAATAALPKDVIHDVLARAYAARIGQALEGLPAEAPLPAEVSASLAGLGRLERYKVDRVRQASKILEPHERLNPILAFQRGEADPRGPEFAELRGIADADRLDRALGAILVAARGGPPDDRARRYDGVMDFLPALAHDRALAHLEAILGDVADIPALRRAQVLEEALMLAGHFGEEALARRVFALLEPLVAAIGPEGAVEIAPLASGMLRTLRRFGLRDEAGRLLGALQAAAKGKTTAHLVARLHTASALAFLGDDTRARPVFDEARVALDGELAMPERLQLGRALTRALGAAPFAFALAGLDQVVRRLEVVSDSFNTNTHVCLSVVDFVEALVLGYASEELNVDPSARRFLDEDEYLVRRRIHDDLAAV